jgi:ABC-type microcin C transport system duplicated ATPase subunit YejF
MHSYLWIPCTQYTKNKNYIETVNEALSIIPKNAFVTAPANIAVQISNREKYSLVGEGGYGDYIILDKNNLSLISDTSTSSNYNQIFNKEGIVVLKKSPKELR